MLAVRRQWLCHDVAVTASEVPPTRDELGAYLDEIGVRHGTYHLYGAHLDDALVIDHRPSGWVVFYSERGGEDILATYVAEAEACSQLVTLLVREPHVFFELIAGPTPTAQADSEFDAWLVTHGISRADLADSDWKYDDVPWVSGQPPYRRYFIKTKVRQALDPGKESDRA
jgi:hypothetical protein